MSAPATVYVNVVDPDADGFARSILTQCLQHATKIEITAAGLQEIRNQIKSVVQDLRREDSFDIIADAPDGAQRIRGNPVATLFFDPRSAIPQSQPRYHFMQCRLLGCATAVHLKQRKAMFDLARDLGIPVIGTLRQIAWGDFGDVAFIDSQKVPGEAMEERIVISTEEMNPDGRHRDAKIDAMITAGTLQERWLARFDQIQVADTDLQSVQPVGGPIVDLPQDFFAQRFAQTDKITPSPGRAILLRTPTGSVIQADVLSAGTLLRIPTKTGEVYANLPPAESLA